MAAEDLLAFIAAVKARTSTPKKPGRKPGAPPVKGRAADPAAPPPARRELTPRQRLDLPSWTHEAIVYLVTQTTCTCGAISRQTNPIPLLRRFHPRYGVHEEALQIAHRSPTLSFLPVVQDLREVEISNCHECLSAPQVDSGLPRQQPLTGLPQWPQEWLAYHPQAQLPLEI